MSDARVTIGGKRSSDAIHTGWTMMAVIAAVLFLGGSCDAEEAEDSVKRDAAILASKITVDLWIADSWRSAPRVEQPLLYFGDATRNNSNGSVWLWGKTGRPAALMELYQPSDRPDDWVFVLTSTSDRKLLGRRSAAEWWKPEPSQLAWNSLPFDPPKSTKLGRLSHMKELARHMTAHQFWEPNNSRFELRLLPSPIYRYDDIPQGLIDGAVFAFTNGTNPEILVLIEDINDAGGRAHWQFACARLGHAEMHLSFDEREVWTVPRVDRMPNTDPYWLHYEMIVNVE